MNVVPEFFEVVRRQRACRTFRPDAVADDLVERVLEAATFAPSAENRQPWEFVVVRDAAMRARIGDLTRQAWRGGARSYSEARLTPRLLADVDRGAEGEVSVAPVLVVVCGDTERAHEAAIPASIFPAVQNLLLAADALGLGAAAHHAADRVRGRAARAARVARPRPPARGRAARPPGPRPRTAAPRAGARTTPIAIATAAGGDTAPLTRASARASIRHATTQGAHWKRLERVNDSAASLAATVLEEEAARQAAQDKAREQVIFPDDLLPGVNAEPMSLRARPGKGGWWMFVVLTALNSLDELEGAAINVLAPEIRRTFGISEGDDRLHRHRVGRVLRARRGAHGLARPTGSSACRSSASRASSSAFFVFLSGLAVNAFMLFWTRFATGIAKANTIPVHGSLIADNYPIGVRARMSALNNMIGHGLGLASPVLVGGHRRDCAGGPEGWRWAWYLARHPGLDRRHRARSS